MIFRAQEKQVNKPVDADTVRLYGKSKVKTPNGVVTVEGLSPNCKIYVNDEHDNLVLATVLSCVADGDCVVLTLRQ